MNIMLPSEGYDYKFFSNYEVSKDEIENILLFIKKGICDNKIKVEYELFGKVYNYGSGSFEVGSRYGLNYHKDCKLWIIFGTERDVAYPFAFFSLRDGYNAARYFLHLIST